MVHHKSIQNLCMPVRPLHVISTLVLATCAQRRWEHRASEVGWTQNLCMPVRPLHVNSTLVLATCAQRRLEWLRFSQSIPKM